MLLHISWISQFIVLYSYSKHVSKKVLQWMKYYVDILIFQLKLDHEFNKYFLCICVFIKKQDISVKLYKICPVVVQ